jgi:hypothetical protein
MRPQHNSHATAIARHLTSIYQHVTRVMDDFTRISFQLFARVIPTVCGLSCTALPEVDACEMAEFFCEN